MNDEKKYNVVFTGHFAPDIDRAVIMQNLANLYKTDVESVAQRFTNADRVLKNNINHAVASQYVAALNNAGALCQAVEMLESKPPTTKSSITLEYQLGVGDIRCSPLPINRITLGQDGININRADKKDVLFRDIVLLSIYENTEIAESKMLLFLKGFKQPFECDCFKITYSDFFDVKSKSMQDSIRCFVNYLFSNNQQLLFDKQTYEFVQGGKLPEFNGDAVRLTTALSAALTQMGIDSPMPETAIESPSIIIPQKQPEPAAEATVEPHAAVKIQAEQNRPVSAVCPKCGRDHAQDQLECSHCGIIFAKWRQKQEREEQAILQANQSKDEPVESDYEWELDNIDLWTQHGTKTFAYLLIGGGVLPLFKHSMLFGSSVLIWPWNIMGFGLEAEKAAAMATVSLPDHLLAWGLLPLCVSVGLLSSRQFMSPRNLAATLFLLGIISLTLMLAVFYEEAEVLGLIFTPPTFGAGIMILLAVIAGASVAGANHLRKRFPEVMPIRVLSGIGGGMMVALMVLQLFASSGGWAGWSMMLLYVLMLGYGLLGLLSAFRPEPEHDLLQRISFVARVVLWWAPVACLIAQNWLTDPYTDFVISSGGGFINIFISLAKCFLLYYGFAFLMALGFTAYLEQSMLKSQALDKVH